MLHSSEKLTYNHTISISQTLTSINILRGQHLAILHLDHDRLQRTTDSVAQLPREVPRVQNKPCLATLRCGQARPIASTPGLLTTTISLVTTLHSQAPILRFLDHLQIKLAYILITPLGGKVVFTPSTLINQPQHSPPSIRSIIGPPWCRPMSMHASLPLFRIRRLPSTLTICNDPQTIAWSSRSS